VVLNSAESILDPTTLFPNFETLRGRARTLFSSLESTDLTLAEGTSFDREFSLLNGQSLAFFEVQDTTLDQIKSTSDSRFRFLSTWKLSNSDRTASFSSVGGVSFNLSLVDGHMGLNALVAQEQGTSTVLDLTFLTAGQSLVGTVSFARESANRVSMGFYRAIDTSGTVLDATTGLPVKVSDGLARYRASALNASNLVDSITGLQVDNRQSFSRAISLAETTYLTPFAIVYGTEYFAFSALNPGGFTHFVSLAQSMFGFEDTPGLGDKDYDDAVLGFSFSKIV
jgi:hypothetical protein